MVVEEAEFTQIHLLISQMVEMVDQAVVAVGDQILMLLVLVEQETLLQLLLRKEIAVLVHQQ
jgi:hypothetical protein